jgi:hypothetical protein
VTTAEVVFKPLLPEFHAAPGDVSRDQAMKAGAPTAAVWTVSAIGQKSARGTDWCPIGAKLRCTSTNTDAEDSRPKVELLGASVIRVKRCLVRGGPLNQRVGGSSPPRPTK